MSSSTKGVVLISILLIVLLLSSVAILFGNKYLLSLKRAQYIEFQSLSLNAFRNIEALSKEKIKKELRFNKNKISKNNPLLKESFYYNLNGADIVVRISDASNCLNINSIVLIDNGEFVENKKSTASIKKILSLEEVDSNVIEEIIDQVIDWIDYDSNPRANGLEDYYYSGPLHNPKEYTGMRLMVSIEELKSIPAVKQIDWSIMQKNFCALPEANQISININTLNINDDYLLSSLFPNISLQEAKYILDNIPDSGFDDLINFKNNFPDMNFEDAYGEIKFNSNIYEINTEINFEDFVSSSISKLIFEGNNNGFIISRIYNGI